MTGYRCFARGARAEARRQARAQGRWRGHTAGQRPSCERPELVRRDGGGRGKGEGKGRGEGREEGGRRPSGVPLKTASLSARGDSGAGRTWARSRRGRPRAGMEGERRRGRGPGGAFGSESGGRGFDTRLRGVRSRFFHPMPSSVSSWSTQWLVPFHCGTTARSSADTARARATKLLREIAKKKPPAGF